MPERFDYPPQMSGSEEAQLAQMWSYLYQMAENLNINMAAIGGNELTDEERKTLQPIIQTGDKTEYNYSEMESLKSLIIKTADFVQTKLSEYRLNMASEMVASGEFGRYVRNTMLDVAINPEGIMQAYSFQEIVQGLKTFEINAKNYIKTGLLRTVNSIPVYGVAIGKDVVTFSEDGTETYNDGNKVAELTADELSFYQGGTKVASYKGNRISFYYGSDEAFYIAGGKIYCSDDIEIASGKKLIIDTETFKINSSGNVTIKGSITAGSTFAGTMSAECVISGTMSADRICGGTLTLGGYGDQNGTIVMLDANGDSIGVWNRNGLYAKTGTFEGALNGATGSFAGSLNAATGTFAGELNAATGTFAGTLSAACVTSGEMSANRIKGGTLTLGGNNNTNGILQIKNASGTIVGTWDKNGIDIQAGSIKADCINSGTLDASQVTVTNIDASKITSNYMSATRIQGGTLTLGGNNNGNGTIRINNASGTQIGKWDKDGISIDAGSVKADCINTGTLNCTNITVSNFDAGWINTGKLSASYIEGGVLTLGGANNGNGVLMIKNASNSTIGQWDNSGLTMYGDMTIQSTGSMTFSGGDFTFQSGGTFTVSASNFTVDISGKIIATGDWGMDEDGISLKTEYTSGGITRRSDFYIGYNPALSSTVQSLGYILPDVQYDIRNTRLAHNIIFGVKRYNDSSATEDLSITLGYQRPDTVILPDPASIGYLCLYPTSGTSALLGSSNYPWREGHIEYIYGNWSSYNVVMATGTDPTIGDSSVPFKDAYITTVHNSSSRTVKEDIRAMESEGEIIDRLEPVSFRYKGQKEKRYGLIWEDTVKILPEICREDPEAEDPGMAKSIVYMDLIPVLLREIQDLRQRVRRLEKTA